MFQCGTQTHELMLLRPRHQTRRIMLTARPKKFATNNENELTEHKDMSVHWSEKNNDYNRHFYRHGRLKTKRNGIPLESPKGAER